jgi:hypothetical protein
MRIYLAQLPWWVYALIVVAIFVIARLYLWPLIRTMQELAGPDG